MSDAGGSGDISGVNLVFSDCAPACCQTAVDYIWALQALELYECPRGRPPRPGAGDLWKRAHEPQRVNRQRDVEPVCERRSCSRRRLHWCLEDYHFHGRRRPPRRLEPSAVRQARLRRDGRADTVVYQEATGN